MIIDNFSKFLKSYAVKSNNSENALLCIKDFCNFIGFPKILQSDNGTEYKNELIKEYCESNNIQQIFCSPRHPQTNGVIETAHKETRRYILDKLSTCNKDINLTNILLDSNHIHNYNVHSITKFKPVDLISNTNEEIYKTVIDNINKKYNKKDLKFKIYEAGTKVRIKPGVYKTGRNIKFRKSKNKTVSVPATILKDYQCGLLYVNIDADVYEFKTNENYFVDASLVVILNEKQWKIIVGICNKHLNDNSNDEDYDEERKELNNNHIKKKHLKKYRKK